MLAPDKSISMSAFHKMLISTKYCSQILKEVITELQKQSWCISWRVILLKTSKFTTRCLVKDLDGRKRDSSIRWKMIFPNSYSMQMSPRTNTQWPKQNYQPKIHHLWRIFSSSLGSVTTTWTPSCILVFWRLKSRQAIFAGATLRGIPWAARPMFRAYPFKR